ncbi:MAG: efflux RND transporter periplasmic adaptor subunit [Desulfomonilaceae bacterium]|nr:efflux RND transporter periplasmic adaptor subunit [Desulfomonilaceae bacterium]
MTRNYLYFASAILLLFLGGCADKTENKFSAPAVKVGVVAAEKGTIEMRLHVSGPLRFIAHTTVSSEVSAQVKSILVEDGQAVKQGQLLLVFDDIKINENAIHAASTLQKNESALAFHKAEFEKNEKLFKSGSVSQSVYDQKFSAYETSRAQVEMDRAIFAKAMEDMKRTRVKSPILGRISKRYVERGDWVSEGGRLFQVSDYTKIYLEARLSDIDLAKLPMKGIYEDGIDAEVGVDAYPGRVFPGRLTYIEPVADEYSLFEIRIHMDNPDMKLLQGMFARAAIIFNTLDNVLRLPRSALLDPVRNHDHNTVFVVNPEGKAVFTRIKIGMTNRRYAQVLEGLSEGDVVVVRGKEILSDGHAVEPKDLSGEPPSQK